jgi:hypothetical protein
LQALDCPVVSFVKGFPASSGWPKHRQHVAAALSRRASIAYPRDVAPVFVANIKNRGALSGAGR